MSSIYNDNLNLCRKIISSIDATLNCVCSCGHPCEDCKYADVCDMISDFRANLNNYIVALADREGVN